MAVDPKEAAAWVQRALGISVSVEGGVSVDGGVNADAAAERVETISPVRLAKCRLIWTQAVDKIHSQVESLKTTMMAALRASDEYDDDELEEVEEAVQELDEMVSGIDVSLVDMVDAVINAAPGAPRVKAQQAAIGKADELSKYVNTDPDFALIDQNEYLATDVKGLTLASLGAIRKELVGV